MRVLYSSLLLLGLGPGYSAHVSSDDAATMFQRIRSLAGDWRGTVEWAGAMTAGPRPAAARYYVTGSGTAVVEDVLNDEKPYMTSVYHLDGDDLRLTHFCSAGNQPRFKADHVDLRKSTASFAFVDITNLKAPDASHVSGASVELLDADHLVVKFQVEAGAKHSVETFHLTRATQP